MIAMHPSYKPLNRESYINKYLNAKNEEETAKMYHTQKQPKESKADVDKLSFKNDPKYTRKPLEHHAYHTTNKEKRITTKKRRLTKIKKGICEKLAKEININDILTCATTSLKKCPQSNTDQARQ